MGGAAGLVKVRARGSCGGAGARAGSVRGGPGPGRSGLAAGEAPGGQVASSGWPRALTGWRLANRGMPLGTCEVAGGEFEVGERWSIWICGEQMVAEDEDQRSRRGGAVGDDACGALGWHTPSSRPEVATRDEHGISLSGGSLTSEQSH